MSHLRLDSLLQLPVQPGTKGLPPAAAGLKLASIASRGWNLLAGDVPFPACVLRRTAIDHNRHAMAAFLREAGLAFSPHGKTTMAPQIFEQQLEDGAWALTCATPAHLITYRALGVPRILYANQLLDPVAIGFVLDELARDPAFEFICLVDSIAGAAILEAAVAARPFSRPLDVLIEIGLPGRRCGVRSLDEVVELATVLDRMAPRVRLRGVEAFEGVVTPDGEGAAQVETLLALVLSALRELSARKKLHEPPIVSVGGSAFFEIVARRLAELPIVALPVLRSGCYIANDHGMYARAQADPAVQGTRKPPLALQPALEVWSHVQSRPEPGLVIVALGKRDISHDIELPIPLHWVRRGERLLRRLEQGVQVRGLNDQHAMITVPPGHPVAVGDMLALGCSHPCTTFDKWKAILVVDDAYDVVDAIATSF